MFKKIMFIDIDKCLYSRDLLMIYFFKYNNYVLSLLVEEQQIGLKIIIFFNQLTLDGSL